MTKKTAATWGLGTLTLSAIVLPAGGAFALLAGTVRVRTGTTAYNSMNVSDGWTAELTSDGTKGRTEVGFANRSTGAKLDLRHAPGRTEIT